MGEKLLVHKLTIKKLITDYTQEVFKCVKCEVGCLRGGFVPMKMMCIGCGMTKGEFQKNYNLTVSWIVGKPIAD